MRKNEEKTRDKKNVFFSTCILHLTRPKTNKKTYAPINTVSPAWETKRNLKINNTLHTMPENTSEKLKINVHVYRTQQDKKYFSVLPWLDHEKKSPITFEFIEVMNIPLFIDPFVYSCINSGVGGRGAQKKRKNCCTASMISQAEIAARQC